ncbi:MAG: NAD(P)/FAD-dependent oxidoreductase [Melioribacteraceae bacterium]|nr:NAD(P)/FAD-dependent oxidoreductase [Melioribacteraceae bacterium]MCF8356468.1 NAD(P)/FAD-dependent oxidoreductase [Melioribacteraceae bacterium]MCF8393380.1 NAD(P)/FAD-dependent oxidoreductase [Melioribacteraceae bacterium]MCF8418945.1 NAD(P)/FAD-dependent oxidoreductase [Melioribacteraceae bacterium]
MTGKNIVILGGGIGGIVAANELRKKLPKNIKITLIEKNSTHSFAASYLWLMVDQRKADKITAPLNTLVSEGVDIIYEEAKSIDISSKLIQTENQKIDYDYLIIAAGAKLESKFLNMLDQDIHNFFTFEGARKLRDKLNQIESGEIVLLIEAMPYKCPGAPYEAAMLIADHIAKRGFNESVKVSLYTPEPQPLPVAGPELGNSVSQILESKNVRLYTDHQLTEVSERDKRIIFQNGAEQKYDLLIVVPKHVPPEVIGNSGLADESNWVPVDKNSLRTNAENVYAIGDVTSITIPGKWKPGKPMKLPKAGVFAHSQALTVSDIIASEILGKESKEIFCGDGFCMLEAGEDLAGFAYGDFFGEPNPKVKMKKLGKLWHLGKVLFEKWWLAPIGFTKSFYRMVLILGGKLLGIPIKL